MNDFADRPYQCCEKKRREQAAIILEMLNDIKCDLKTAEESGYTWEQISEALKYAFDELSGW